MHQLQGQYIRGLEILVREIQVEVPLLGHWLEEVEEVEEERIQSAALVEVEAAPFPPQEVVEEVEVGVPLRLLDSLEEVSVRSFFAPN